MTQSDSSFTRFSDLALPDELQKAIQAVGYENPTPIQQKTIPPLIEGRDLLGHAPTGTGKTAAFALPILTRLDMNARGVQALVEADEMLRMGFIDDVEWILEQTPATRQMALFSATMPSVIKRIASKHLTKPVEITIEGKQSTADTIRQRYWMVSGLHKLDALTRILEAETFDAMLVFVRTRNATVELAEKLSARGFAASAMNGDMPQKQREQMVDKLKKSKLDILVATDVVARGLDVDRISHVVNYDIPYDTEAYVHRIGRTGRAGRSGDAILFVTQRERRLLGAIEKATRQKIEALQLPTVEMVNNKRIADFKQRIADTLAGGELAYLQRLVEEFSHERDVPAERVGAALAKMCMGDQPLLLNAKPQSSRRDKSADKRERREPATTRQASTGAVEKTTHAAVAKVDNHSPDKTSKAVVDTTPKPSDDQTPSRAERRRAAEIADVQMERFRVEVGQSHGVKPENLVGAIANEAGLNSEFIGRIQIDEKHSFVELPAGKKRKPRKTDGVKRSGAKRTSIDGKSGSAARSATRSATSDEAKLAEKREKKKKERHRVTKNKGKRTP